jgi:hypothetical protein
MTLWEERAARNEALFRQVNEEIRDLDSRFGSDASGEFVCECADDGCVRRLSVAVDDYLAVREHARRFIVSPGHEDGELEVVVDRRGEYFVVEKYGTPGEIAERLDPQRD